MRSLFLVLTLTLLTVVSGFVMAQDTRVGFVDMRVVMSRSVTATNARKSFEQTLKAENQKFEGEKVRLQKSMDQLNRDAAIMSESELKKKQQALARELKAYQEKGAKAKNQIDKRRQELNRQIMRQVAAVVEEIARERKLSAVYERTAGGLLFADPALDISEEVAKRMDDKAGKK